MITDSRAYAEAVWQVIETARVVAADLPRETGVDVLDFLHLLGELERFEMTGSTAAEVADMVAEIGELLEHLNSDAERLHRWATRIAGDADRQIRQNLSASGAVDEFIDMMRGQG